MHIVFFVNTSSWQSSHAMSSSQWPKIVCNLDLVPLLYTLISINWIKWSTECYQEIWPISTLKPRFSTQAFANLTKIRDYIQSCSSVTLSLYSVLRPTDLIAGVWDEFFVIHHICLFLRDGQYRTYLRDWAFFFNGKHTRNGKHQLISRRVEFEMVCNCGVPTQKLCEVKMV